jgi:hypothetical protein
LSDLIVSERFESNEINIGDSSSITRQFILEYPPGHDEVSDLQAEADFVSQLARIYGGFGLASYALKIFAYNKWFATATYGSGTPSDEDKVMTFDTSGGTHHITQSLDTVQRYTASGTAPNFNGAINVTPTGVEGTDIVVPVYNFTETHYRSNTKADADYRQILFEVTGKVNGGTFNGYERGSLLFLGASGSRRGTDKWELNYKFAASPNRVDLAVGAITGIEKEGWQYLWVQYAEQEDATAKAMVKKPQSVHIEQVYEYGDFDLLDLG